MLVVSSSWWGKARGLLSKGEELSFQHGALSLETKARLQVITSTLSCMKGQDGPCHYYCSGTHKISRHFLWHFWVLYSIALF